MSVRSIRRASDFEVRRSRVVSIAEAGLAAPAVSGPQAPSVAVRRPAARG